MYRHQQLATQGTTSPEQRKTYYKRIGEHSLAPLWESLHDLVTVTPTTPVVPHKWDYDGEVRALLMEAGGLISTREAERRVLVLENPGLPAQASITHTLYAGFQLVLPGEIARSHRHSQAALRFVIEGRGAYTAVDGEQTFMSPGDLVITPSWYFHDHGNETDTPVVWLDGLDVPLVRLLDASFAETGATERQALRVAAGDSTARFGANLAPVDWRPQSRSSPLFSYPYDRSRESLTTLARNGAPDPCHGYKMRYVNPASGDHVTPTIGTFIQLLPRGMTTSPYRCTDGTVYTVVEGTGSSTIGNASFTWKPRDVFVAPSWSSQIHRASEDAVLFSFSDRPVQERLGLWRQERAAR